MNDLRTKYFRTQTINKMYKNCDITHRCVGVDPPRAAPGLPIPPTLLLLRWRAAERALVSDEDEEDCEDDDQEDEDNLDAKPFLPHLLLLTQRCYFGDLALFLDEDDYDDDDEDRDENDDGDDPPLLTWSCHRAAATMKPAQIPKPPFFMLLEAVHIL